MPIQSSNSAVTIALKKQQETAHQRDILLAIEQLFRREENAVGFVLSRLYDIGSANLIDKKLPIACLKPPLRLIAQRTRPAFRFFAVRWFHRNCPEMIADWLHSLVVFDPDTSSPSSESGSSNQSSLGTEAAAIIDINANLNADLNTSNERTLALAVQQKHHEVIQLQQQLRQTMIFAIAIAALFGSATLWLGFELHQVRLSSAAPRSPLLETKAIP